jgi:tight adherence protein B
MNEIWLRALFLACIFGAVLLAAEVLVGTLSSKRTHIRAINLRLKMIGQGRRRDETMKLLRRSTSALPSGLPPVVLKFARRMELLLVRAQVTVPTARLLLVLLLAPLILFFLILALMIATGVPIAFGRLVLVGAFSAAAGGLIPIMVLQYLANRSRKKMQEQFPVAIDVFVRGLRAGHPVAAALDLLTVEMPDPIGSEFGVVVDEVTYGADLRDALHAMAERWDLDDMRMFVVSLSVQNETGGNLAEILENLSKVIRERASMMMKVRALSSEGRMTAMMLTILPVAAFVVLFLLSPGFYLDVADDPAFIPGFVGMLISYALGVLWIRKLVDLKV